MIAKRPPESWIVERGERAGATAIDRFIGASNTGGLGPFKGKPAKGTSRYRRLQVGDFVYNPMCVNVGFIALCRRADEEGWVSPDYVVFRLTDVATVSDEYLLTFLKSELGRAEIDLSGPRLVVRVVWSWSNGPWLRDTGR